MDASIEDFVCLIHHRPCPLVLAITGGGSGAIAELLRVPGASRTVLEALVPYSAASLAAFLGAAPEQACSERTARAMAMAAFQRARAYASEVCGEGKLLGVGCTASLASDRPKKGTHRLHVAVQSLATTAAWSLELAKGRRSRAEEEDLAMRVVLNAVAESAGLDNRLALPLGADEAVQSVRTAAPVSWQELLLGRREMACQGDELSATSRRAVFPGAFNPLHSGHRQMERVAAQRLSAPVVFEISMENVDKPPLDYAEIERRGRQFGQQEMLCFTRAPTFVEKARLFPGATFVVGVDTIVRIADARYYGGSSEACAAAIGRIAAAGCRFLVFGRRDESTFRTLGQLELPQALRELCEEVSEQDFRQDISSTQLRRLQPAEE